MTIDINTILHTKDGRKVGNAIVTGRSGNHWEIVTDYGNKMTELTSQDLDEMFYIAWIDEENGDEIQKMQQEDHKHRIDV